jgi:hypothetical protein
MKLRHKVYVITITMYHLCKIHGSDATPKALRSNFLSLGTPELLYLDQQYCQSFASPYLIPITYTNTKFSKVNVFTNIAVSGTVICHSWRIPGSGVCTGITHGNSHYIILFSYAYPTGAMTAQLVQHCTMGWTIGVLGFN